MPRILAIDPGTAQSAWLFFEDGRPNHFGMYPNAELLDCIRKPADDLATFKEGLDLVVIETIEPRYGLRMGWETLDTSRYIGKLEEASRPLPVVLLKSEEHTSELQSRLHLVSRLLLEKK